MSQPRAGTSRRYLAKWYARWKESGHDLEAWLVSEVIDQMSSPTHTLVLLQPDPAVQDSELAATRALTKYWRRVGLNVIEEHREFMG